MRLTDSQIRQMVMDLYPEIERLNIGMSTEFNEDMVLGPFSRVMIQASLSSLNSSYLTSCFNEHNCVYFTNQIMNVIDSYCLESGSCSV